MLSGRGTYCLKPRILSEDVLERKPENIQKNRRANPRHPGVLLPDHNAYVLKKNDWGRP